MKRILSCLFTGMLLVSCGSSSEDAPKAETLVFGTYFGMCQGTCFVTYRLASGVLQADRNETYISGDYTFEPTETLPAEDYTRVAGLLTTIPAVLRNGDGGTLGCPDCADQGGVYVDFTDAQGKRKVYYLDTNNTSDQAEAVVRFKTRILEAVDLLRPQ